MNRRITSLRRTEYIEKLLTPSIKNSHGIKLSDCEGLEELGVTGKGLVLNNDFKSWKYNRQFFYKGYFITEIY